MEPLLGLLSSNNLPNLAKISRLGKSNRWSSKRFFQEHGGLHQAVFIDRECGGATDTVFSFGLVVRSLLFHFQSQFCQCAFSIFLMDLLIQRA